MKSKVLMAYCTFPNSEIAEAISRECVSEGLAACANVFPPHTAIYAWKNQIQNESECAVIFKLNARKQVSLTERIRAKHPYSVPALVFWPIESGLPEFLHWVYGQSL